MSTLIRPLYPVKGPFVKSHGAFGYSGVVEYNEESDTIRCHECGEWFQNLDPHLRRTHHTTSAAYKMKYGLNLGMPLCGKKMSETRRLQMTDEAQQARRRGLRARKFKRSAPKRQHGTQSIASKNKYGLCDLQMKARYEIVKKAVGHQPTTQELRSRDHALLSAIERRFKTLNKFRVSVGDRPVTAQEYQEISESDLIESLVRWKKQNGRIPRASDFKTAHDGYPQYTTIYGHFGSWSNALALAGLSDS